MVRGVGSGGHKMSDPLLVRFKVTLPCTSCPAQRLSFHLFPPSCTACTASSALPTLPLHCTSLSPPRSNNSPYAIVLCREVVDVGLWLPAASCSYLRIPGPSRFEKLNGPSRFLLVVFDWSIFTRRDTISLTATHVIYPPDWAQFLLCCQSKSQVCSVS